MNRKDILDYARKTPTNTNVNVLGSMIDSVVRDSGGSGGSGNNRQLINEITTVLQLNEEDLNNGVYSFTDKDYDESKVLNIDVLKDMYRTNGYLVTFYPGNFWTGYQGSSRVGGSSSKDPIQGIALYDTVIEYGHYNYGDGLKIGYDITNDTMYFEFCISQPTDTITIRVMSPFIDNKNYYCVVFQGYGDDNNLKKYFIVPKGESFTIEANDSTLSGYSFDDITNIDWYDNPWEWDAGRGGVVKDALVIPQEGMTYTPTKNTRFGYLFLDI